MNNQGIKPVRRWRDITEIKMGEVYEGDVDRGGL